jgi:hypothetical protein
MQDDDYTWGFDKQTAQQLKASVGGDDREHPNSAGRMNPILYGKTKAGGLTIGVPANVLLYDVDGNLTAEELLAETKETDIPADSNIVLASAYGRWRALLLPEVEIIQVTSNTKDADGYYPGNVQKFDTITKTWSTVRTCKVRDVNA